MYVFSATAEYQDDDGFREAGLRYALLVFVAEQDRKAAIERTAEFLGDSGWNNIDVDRSKVLRDDQKIEDPTLQRAYEDAVKNGISIVVYTEPSDVEPFS